MISLEEFVKSIENELEDIESGTLTPEKNYKELDEWSSMYALIIIAFVDSEFDVELTGDDLRKCNHLKDLYELIKMKV